MVRESWLELYSSIKLPGEEDYYTFFKSHEFEGVQNGDPAFCAFNGLRYTHSGKIRVPGDIKVLVEHAKNQGADCMTVHAGTGMESDSEIDFLVGDLLNVAAKEGFPIFLETHRATITQDMWRTVQLVKRFPEIEFNGDFSHWYTGQEMRYGKFQMMEMKFEFLQPVFDRIGFMHGRIGNGSCMQRDFTAPEMDIHVTYFKEMWTRSLIGFLRKAAPGDYIIFAPELLRVSSNYAVTFVEDGVLKEEGNRLELAVKMKTLIEDCWVTACKRLKNEE